MGSVRIIDVSPLATIQDLGRFGYRKYGIPQSGAIDPAGMQLANKLVNNDEMAPVIEFALGGVQLEVVEPCTLGVFGAALKLDGQPVRENAVAATKGAVVELSSPKLVYGYLAMGGKLIAEKQFDSFSTYLPGGFGGNKGRLLRKGDLIQTSEVGSIQNIASRAAPGQIIQFYEGPEFASIESSIGATDYQIDPVSNRIGIRLIGKPILSSISEIKSSAVVPGTIQLLPNGQLVVLMNDCQTTGGYPRIGKVYAKDLWKLGQTKPGNSIRLKQIS